MKKQIVVPPGAYCLIKDLATLPICAYVGTHPPKNISITNLAVASMVEVLYARHQDSWSELTMNDLKSKTFWKEVYTLLKEVQMTPNDKTHNGLPPLTPKPIIEAIGLALIGTYGLREKYGDVAPLLLEAATYRWQTLMILDLCTDEQFISDFVSKFPLTPEHVTACREQNYPIIMPTRDLVKIPVDILEYLGDPAFARKLKVYYKHPEFQVNAIAASDDPMDKAIVQLHKHLCAEIAQIKTEPSFMMEV